MLRAWRADARPRLPFTRRAGRWRLWRCALRRQSVATSTCLIDARLASACTFPQAWAPAGAARAPARAALTASARRGVLRVRRAEGIRDAFDGARLDLNRPCRFWTGGHGAWRSLVSARALGARGRRFESARPDHSAPQGGERPFSKALT